MMNTNSKDFLAKLLATENITVVHSQVQTASFDVKDRVLTLPVWQEMSEETYDHLTGHEVGHALFTPVEGWVDEIKEEDRAFKSFLNVIEDARIEKLIQRKYPGLRRSFMRSYRKMFADGFFGGDIDVVNDMKLIDRINVYFKCGGSIGVNFLPEEKHWIPIIEKIETWNEVVEVAKLLYGKAKEELEKSEQLIQEIQNDTEDLAEEEQFDDFDEFGENESDEMDDHDSSEEDSEEDEYSDNVDESEETESSQEIAESDSSSISSITEDCLKKNICKEYVADAKYDVKTFFVDLDRDLSCLIVPNRIFLESVRESEEKLYIENMGELEQHKTNLFKSFMTNNKKTINYLVKEFEMKKSADIYSRVSLSNTGMIDTVKMNSYRYSDDIFRRVSSVPEGKNHGLLMFIDWSGSMQRSLAETVDQLLNLVYFCRQINIPYQVYLFNTGSTNGEKIKEVFQNFDINEIQPESDTRLIEVFTNKMNAQKTAEIAKILLAFGRKKQQYNSFRYYHVNMLDMNSTPLNTTIIAAMGIFDRFKSNNRIDVVNTVFLTDGDSDPLKYVSKVPNFMDQKNDKIYYTTSSVDYRIDKNSIYKIVNKKTKKQYRIPVKDSSSISNSIMVTGTLLKMYQDYTGSNAIGFRIIPQRLDKLRISISNIVETPEKLLQIQKSLRNEKFCELPNCSYKKYFAIPEGSDLAVSNGSIVVSDSASKGQIKRAFMNASNSRMTSRVLLTRFIELIA